jgi:hypothetical protein
MTSAKKHRSRWLQFAAVTALVLVAVGSSGCYLTWDGVSLATGQNLPEREAVLAAARAQKFDFDTTLISSSYGVDHSQVVLTGPLVRILGTDAPGVTRNGYENGYSVKKIEYTEATMELKNGKWEFASGTEHAARPFSGILE